MALRKALVVDVHPEDHSVDLLMVDNYARFVGVQVQVGTGSTRSGSIELPDVEVRKPDKWDISKRTGQEVMALVDFAGYVPIVTGFLLPQISQMTHTDGKLKYSRHTSDVQTYTDGEGNMGILHPGGAYITISEGGNPKDFTGGNFDKNLKVDRNTDKKVTVKVSLADKAVVVTLAPDGSCSIECKTATIKASDSILLDTPVTTVSGTLHVKKEVTTDSSITSKGDQVAGADGISQIGHKHMGHGSGNPTGPAQN
ncbi:hypothetical protein ZL58_14395 [Salmonella enterica subsp. enterica serovar Typhimurium]|nr:hypothetical protein [Salmonella enterica subsp. enterica serovar Typhimurium]